MGHLAELSDGQYWLDQVSSGWSQLKIDGCLVAAIARALPSISSFELLWTERHVLLECPALADLRDEFSPLIAECSGVMARLVWARNQPMVSRYIIACLDRMSC